MTHGASHARSAQDNLAAIIGGTRNLSRVLAKVSESGRSQTEGFREFTRDIEEIGQSTQSLSAETEIIAGATRRLDKLMADLGDTVRTLEAGAERAVSLLTIPAPCKHTRLVLCAVLSRLAVTVTIPCYHEALVTRFLSALCLLVRNTSP